MDFRRCERVTKNRCGQPTRLTSSNKNHQVQQFFSPRVSAPRGGNLIRPSVKGGGRFHLERNGAGGWRCHDSGGRLFTFEAQCLGSGSFVVAGVARAARVARC